MQRSQQLRTATQTRRSARAGYPEPDDFEGLPVRQWRQEWVSVAPSQQQETTQQGDLWARELFYGMPRESHLLPPHSQELLRAARSGRLYKRPAPTEEEEPDADVDIVKGEKKDWEPPSDGYMVKLWKQVPRNAENPTTSHLAKRHKNTVTLASRAIVAPHIAGPTVTRATVRRIDAAGNPYEQTVTLTDGQQVKGEIISTTVVPAPSAAKGDLPLQQAAPVRRRPPPPKRKAKGAGRGRKKGKLPLPLPATRSQATTADGAPPINPEAVGPDGIKIEDTEDSANQDSEMAGMSGIPSEDEEGDGGEGEEDEEGEDEAGEDEGGETPNIADANANARVQEVEDTEMSEAIQPTSVEEPGEFRPTPEEGEEVATPPKVRFQPPTLANLAPPHTTMNLASVKIEGSPLKNVMILSPTEASPRISPQAANTSFAASNYLEVQSRTVAMDLDSNTVSQAYATVTTVSGVLPPLREKASFKQAASQETPPPAEVSRPAPAEEPTAAAATATNMPDQPQQTAEPEPAAVPATTDEAPEPAAEALPETTQPAPEVSLQEQQQPPTPPSPPLLPTTTVEDDEDDGLNLLGSLERELDRQEGRSSASSGSGEKETPNNATPPAAAAAVPTATAAAAAAATEATPAEAQAAAAAAAAEPTTNAEGTSSADAQAPLEEEEEGAAAPAETS
ncbi:hypothetical protein C8A00DRAFT_42209 [Chaetomidium leptoderma]|uniref:Uncharacterized protein n=1 Tax=Chaetomidium leptoderma TaxID=669021 RepID=A0AAN6VPS8_9PEZI|nr:hypothetical protein C8A00DRAFT_42209 [Chaetomidium leptoderma]